MGNNLRHYFIEDDTLLSNYEQFNYFFGDNSFCFISNSGLFSPGHVDYATNLLLHTIPQPQGSLLDLGCGYGVIGITLEKVYNLNVTLSDVNGRALECAKKNCALNKVKANIIKSDCFENIHSNYDVITLNPPIHAGKKIIFNMYKGAFEHLNSQGNFYVVIQKKHGAESTYKALFDIFNNCEILYKKKGYYVLSCTKM